MQSSLTCQFEHPGKVRSGLVFILFIYFTQLVVHDQLARKVRERGDSQPRQEKKRKEYRKREERRIDKNLALRSYCTIVLHYCQNLIDLIIECRRPFQPCTHSHYYNTNHHRSFINYTSVKKKKKNNPYQGDTNNGEKN